MYTVLAPKHPPRPVSTDDDVPICNAGIASTSLVVTEVECWQDSPVNVDEGPGTPGRQGWGCKGMAASAHCISDLITDCKCPRSPSDARSSCGDNWVLGCSATLRVGGRPRLWPEIVAGTIVVVVVVQREPRFRPPICCEETVAAWAVDAARCCERLDLARGKRGMANSRLTPGEVSTRARKNKLHQLLRQEHEDLKNRKLEEPKCFDKFEELLQYVHLPPSQPGGNWLKQVSNHCKCIRTSARLLSLTNFKVPLWKYYVPYLMVPCSLA